MIFQFIVGVIAAKSCLVFEEIYLDLFNTFLGGGGCVYPNARGNLRAFSFAFVVLNSASCKSTDGNLSHGLSPHLSMRALFVGIYFLGSSLYSTCLRGDASPPGLENLPVVRGLVDPLLNADGSKITTVAEWRKHREEMKAIIEYYLLGRMPPPPGNVRGETLKSKTVLDGEASYRLVRLTFGPQSSLHLDVAIYVPTGKPGPFATIIYPSFYATPGDSITTPPGQAPSNEEELVPILHRGYAVLTYNYQSCGADSLNYRSTAFFPAYPGYDWRDIGAWAWGISRCVDYLESQDFVDKTRIMAVGHSRLGKTVLAAGAFDERIALSVPAGSGCGGGAAFRYAGKRREGGEGLEDVTKAFPYWFNPRLSEFCNQEEKLPFDQHWLLALTAPRALLEESGLDEAPVSPIIRCYLAARPVYNFLGAGDKFGIYLRPGGHRLGPDDWQIILDFADKEFFGKPTARPFNFE